MHNLNPYQECPVCKRQGKLIFKSAGSPELVFERHYMPDLVTLCPNTAVFTRQQLTKQNPVAALPANKALKKCGRCWQSVQVVPDGDVYRLKHHKVVSERSACPGSGIVVTLP